MDEDLLRRIKAGDIGGLEQLVARYQERALQIAFLITGDPSKAQDIVQDAFIRAYDQIGHFDLTRPFGPWFFKDRCQFGRPRRQPHPAGGVFG